MPPARQHRSLMHVQAAVKSAHERIESRRALAQVRAANQNPERPSEAELSKLDSSIKKNGALAKKLRVLTDAAADGAIKDLHATNQSKFLSEAIQALFDACRKPSRVSVRTQGTLNTLLPSEACCGSLRKFAAEDLEVWKTCLRDNMLCSAGYTGAAPPLCKRARGARRRSDKSA